MKNYKLCQIGEESSTTIKTKLKEKKTCGKDMLLSGLRFTLFSLTFTTQSLQVTQTSIVLFLQSLPEHILSFLGIGAHSATAALFSICILLFGVPLLFLRSLLYDLLELQCK